MSQLASMAGSVTHPALPLFFSFSFEIDGVVAGDPKYDFTFNTKGYIIKVAKIPVIISDEQYGGYRM